MTTAPALEHVFTPRGSAKQLFAERGDEVLIVGPAGTGKSRACLEKMHLAATVNPGFRGLIVRKTAVSLTTSALMTWERDVVPESLAAGLLSFYGGSVREPAQYRYMNGSKIMVGGLDKSSKIMSTEYDLIFVQEATELTEGDWEDLTTRLRSGKISFQQLLADCNPSHAEHWLKKRCDRGQTLMLLSRHEDNPLLFDDDGNLTVEGAAYIGKLDNLTGPRHARLRKGEWSSAEGVVYEHFDTAVHVVNPFPIPDAWPRTWVVDFGYTNPMVVQCWADDPDGRAYMYREWYHTQKTVPEFAADIAATVAPGGEWIEPQPGWVVCDHDSDRQGTSMRDILARELKTRGVKVRTKPAKKDVKVGIQRVTDRLKPAGDGKPRLFLLRDALVKADADLVDRSKPTCTADELPGYIWDSTPGKEPKETPVKEDDHGADCVRYYCMFRDGEKRTVTKIVSVPGGGRLPDRIG